METKQMIPVGIALLTALGGGGYSAVEWKATASQLKDAQETAIRRLSKYHSAKELARECMGEEAFDREWQRVLGDLAEVEAIK